MMKLWTSKLFNKPLKYNQQKVLFGVIFLAPWLIGFFGIFLYTMIDSVIYSFSNVYFLGPSTPEAISNFISQRNIEGTTFFKLGILFEFINFENFTYSWNIHSEFRRVLVNSMIEASINLPVIIIFSLLIATTLNTKFKGNLVARAIFFLPVILASEAVTIALSQALDVQSLMQGDLDGVFGNFQFNAFLIEAGFPEFIIDFLALTVNTIFRVISISGVQILIFLAGLQSIPTHLYEAAKVEGATAYESFWKITIPMVSPHIITVGVFTIVDSFLRSPVTRLIIQTKDAQQYGVSSSMAWMYFLAVIVFLGAFIFIANKGAFYYDDEK
jgi:ABC-type sugar transport system permease subunit